MTLKDLSDQELVDHILNNHHQDYKELVRRYQGGLWRYANSLLNNEEEASDVVQEGLIKAYQNLMSYKKEFKLSSWLYRIVHNQAITLLRKKKAVTTNPDVFLFIADDKPSLEENVEKEKMIKAVHSCLARLRENYRVVLSLYYLEDKTYEEVSDILRIPMNTVATHIFRAKRELLAICKKEGLNL